MNHSWKLKRITIQSVGVLMFASLVFAASRAASLKEAAVASPKYIFIFLADGAGIAHMEITRQYNQVIHGEGLVVADKIMKEGTLGLLTTHAADSLSTDSAAAATALAHGCKAKIGTLGVCADGTVTKTITEIAKDNGMRIGLVTNATAYDAGPAAFACHVENRRQFGNILDQYLQLAPDILMGGGRDQFLPSTQPGGERKDNTNLIESFVQKGYSYASNKKELDRVKSGKLLGLFAWKDMSFEIERDKQTEPSVYDMTQAAIRILHQSNSRGFVLLVENENIDTAAHLTDVASLIHD